MENIHPDQARAIRDFFLPSIEAEHKITRAIIQSVPADKLDFKLTPTGKPISQLIWQLVGTEHLYLTGICEARIPAAPEQPESSSPQAVLAWDDGHFPQDYRRLAQLSGEDLLRQVEFLGATKPVVEFLPVYMSAVLQNRGLLLAYIGTCLAQVEAAPAQDAQPSKVSAEELNEGELADVVGGTGSVPPGVTVVASYAPNAQQQQAVQALYAQQHPNSGLGALIQGGTPAQVIGVALGGTALGYAVTGGAATAAAAAAEKSAQAAVMAFDLGVV